MSCISCQTNLKLFRTQCVETCPDGTFLYENSICFECVSPCKTCISEGECTSCLPGYFQIISENKCVNEYECPIRTYADKTTLRCEDCFITCLTCHGPTYKDCILCNFARGYAKGALSTGLCYMLVCKDGDYLKMDYALKQALCAPCDPACKTCIGPNSDACMSCEFGYTSMISVTTSKLSCLDCAKSTKGFYKLPDGHCEGILH